MEKARLIDEMETSAPTSNSSHNSTMVDYSNNPGANIETPINNTQEEISAAATEIKRLTHTGILSTKATSKSTGASNPQASFTKMPLELREKIYELLLRNPLLGTRESVERSHGYGSRTKYDLSPALLAVNRQINEEADGWLIDASKAIMPLELLRNISLFSIRSAQNSEIPSFVSQLTNSATNTTQEQVFSYLTLQLVNLVQGDGPVECASDMFDNLLAYAETFERFLTYKKGMALYHHETLWLPGMDNRDTNRLHHYNPFRQYHPVERNLLMSRLASDANELQAFKQKRAEILQYLEPHVDAISKPVMGGWQAGKPKPKAKPTQQNTAGRLPLPSPPGPKAKVEIQEGLEDPVLEFAADITESFSKASASR
ncbi:hypothetical protein EG329_010949 [Mollisiaceae sp. DMI_Dod_QoI]|nr:hypothetical protein EG329_010949 [Helotiales sp. DMI_Dod_QoI]